MLMTLKQAQNARAKAAQAPIQPVFVITVEDPQKVGDPVRGYTMYTVHTKVSIFSCSNLLPSITVAHRRLVHYFQSLHFPCFAVSLTFCGYMRLCQTITLVLWFHQYQRRILLADFRTLSSSNGDLVSSSVFKR
jgi:hypothetical protein